MNAVNPIPTASGAEPSMEEILASIRRIIADDQSMPGHAAALPGPEHDAVEDLSRAREATPESRPDEAAAPQALPPEGPASVMDTPHPLAPHAPVVAGTHPVDAAALPEGLHDEPDPHEAALRDMHDGSDLHLHDFATREPPMSTDDMSTDDVSARHESAPEFPAPEFPAPEFPAHEVAGEAPGGLFSAATSQSLAAAFNTLAVSRLAADSQALRGLAQEMLRPMLKDWLDENLPSMVEGIIRDEIDRMSRGGR